MIGATYKFVLLKGNKRVSDGYTLYFQVIYQRQVKRFSLGSILTTSSEDWDPTAMRFRKNANMQVEKNAILDNLRVKANAALFDFERNKEPFTFDTFFEKVFPSKRAQESKTEQTANTKVFDFIVQLVNEMKAKGQLGNARVYSDFLRVLKLHHKGKILRFEQIDYKFLKAFEQRCYERGCTGGGIHNYFRTLRAIYNEAIRRSEVSKDTYPFKSQLNPNGYSLGNLKSEAKPRALSLQEMEQFKHFPTDEHPELNLAYKVFLFSYYAYGINLGDLCRLRKSQIKDGHITYRRSKTKKDFTIAVHPIMQAIIDEFDSEQSDYLFPFLTDEIHKIEQQKINRIHKATKQVNADLKVIGKICKFTIPLTTYVARHTFATTLKMKGVSIALISESMNHADISTTQAYLQSFEQGHLDELGGLL